MKKIICFFKLHKRGKTWCSINPTGNGQIVNWHVECERCGKRIAYTSPRTRLIAVEMRHGFTGD